MNDKYKFMAPVYNFLSTIYSVGKIDRCREAMIGVVGNDDKVLFAGVGHGKEAIKLIKNGANVTVVDLSAGMLRQFEELRKKNKISDGCTAIHDSILNVDKFEQYDYVFANFFLNIFPEDQMELMLDHLLKLVKPGGSIVIGDWSYPKGNPISQLINKLSWYFGALPFILMTGNAFHPIYNYAKLLQDRGFEITEKKYFRNVGVNCYCSIRALKRNVTAQAA